MPADTHSLLQIYSGEARATKKEIPIYEADLLRGKLQTDRQGLRTEFRAECPAWEGEGIQKLWLRDGRGSLLLGTLVPEGNTLRLERTVSNAMLREKGLEHCARAELETRTDDSRQDIEPGWQSLDKLKLPGLDRELADSLGQMKNGVWRRTEDGYCIRCPWQPGQRMPCMPLFCFASYSSRRGGYLVWLLDESGNPRMGQV